jgi:glucosylceramidase
MCWTKEQMYSFVQNHLGPKLQQNGYGHVLLIGYDHNCDNTEFPIHVAQSTYISGTAFHLYGGDISALSTVYNATGKGVWFTEQYTDQNGSFQGDLGWHMQNVMLGSMQHHARAAIEWNLVNDPLYNLHTDGGCSSCKGALTMQSGSIQSRNVSYYIVAQMSRVVQRGAVRIASSGATDINHCAFLNPDGSIGIVLYNNQNDDRSVDLVYNNRYTSFTVHGNGVTSVLLYDAVPSPAEGMESNPLASSDTQKVLHQGMLLIRRNGRCYSATGIQIK